MGIIPHWVGLECRDTKYLSGSAQGLHVAVKSSDQYHARKWNGQIYCFLCFLIELAG